MIGNIVVQIYTIINSILFRKIRNGFEWDITMWSAGRGAPKLLSMRVSLSF